MHDDSALRGEDNKKLERPDRSNGGMRGADDNKANCEDGVFFAIKRPSEPFLQTDIKA